VADEILIHYEQVVKSLTLLPSSGGRFEIRADGETIYSKLQTGRHVRPGEAVDLLKSRAAAVEKTERLGY
jgi:selenoprotein W-related protein